MLPRSGNLAAWLPGCLLFASLGICLARVPHAVVARRVAEIRHYRQAGPEAFFLRAMDPKAPQTLRLLGREVPAEAAILYGGVEKGALEFAAPLLFPRLLVRETEVPPTAEEHLGRPLGRLALDKEAGAGGEGVVVLEGTGEGLRLLLRPPR